MWSSDVFRLDPDFEKNEEMYEEIKKDILGEDSDEEEEDGDSEGSDEEGLFLLRAVARRGAEGTAPVGAPPQTPGRPPQERCWGLRPRPPLGLRPRHRWGLPPPDLLLNGVWGGAPAVVWGRAPSYILAKPPWGLGRSPNSCVHDSIKPAGLVRYEEPNLSESSLAGGL